MNQTHPARRDLLKASAAAAAFTIVAPQAVRGTAANSKVQLGLVGCGGRGGWIAPLFHEHSNCQIVACHDYFKDRVETIGTRLQIDAARRHVGLDGYKALVEGKVDGVMIISPPCFHPEQAIYAMEKGKHVYLAKPVGVDVAGTVALMNAAEKVKGKLSVWVDFQTRMNEFYQGAYQKIVEGLIGEPVCGQAYYHAGRLGVQAQGDSQMARLRNWVFDIALSGDIIVEQNIHVLDVANWYLRGHPVKAYGYGGRRARVDVGDCRDHFVIAYTYPNDVLLDFSSTQFLYGFGDLCCRIYGKQGTADTHYGGQVTVRAKSNVYKGGTTPHIYTDGAIANIKQFVAGIESGKPVHNCASGCESTLTAILGRMAVEERREVTWDEMIKSNKQMDLKLELPAAGTDWKP